MKGPFITEFVMNGPFITSGGYSVGFPVVRSTTGEAVP